MTAPIIDQNHPPIVNSGLGAISVNAPNQISIQGSHLGGATPGLSCPGVIITGIAPVNDVNNDTLRVFSFSATLVHGATHEVTGHSSPEASAEMTVTMSNGVDPTAEAHLQVRIPDPPDVAHASSQMTYHSVDGARHDGSGGGAALRRTRRT